MAAGRECGENLSVGVWSMDKQEGNTPKHCGQGEHSQAQRVLVKSWCYPAVYLLVAQGTSVLDRMQGAVAVEIQACFLNIFR